jgi:hypothetical protein
MEEIEGETEREVVRDGVRAWGITLSLPLSAVNGEVQSRGRSRGERGSVGRMVDRGAWRQ